MKMKARSYGSVLIKIVLLLTDEYTGTYESRRQRPSSSVISLEWLTQTDVLVKNAVSMNVSVSSPSLHPPSVFSPPVSLHLPSVSLLPPTVSLLPLRCRSSFSDQKPSLRRNQSTDVKFSRFTWNMRCKFVLFTCKYFERFLCSTPVCGAQFSCQINI